MISARKRIWGWYFFDWASQPYNTLLLTFIFGPYFAEIARGYYLGTGMEEEAAKAAAQAYWAFGLTISSIVVACLAPILGAVADGTGRRLIWVWIFSLFYIFGAWGLWWVAPGGEIGMLRWAVFAFGVGFIGMEFATIFTNALMPSLTQSEDVGKLSGNGFAFGYLGGLIALVIMLGFFVTKGDSGLTYLNLTPVFGADSEAQEGTRIVGPLAAVWYAVFMVPFFLWVKEPKIIRYGGIHIGGALASLKALLVSLRYRRSLAAYLASSLAYRDALNGLYAFGGVYASNVLGWDIGKIGIFGILGGITAMAASWVGGRLDARFGPRFVIGWSVVVLILVCLVVVGLNRESLWGFALDPASTTPDTIFYICGGLIGAAGGPLQAASRTLLVRHTTPDRATEAFGIFALSGKVASFITPLLIGIVSYVSQSPQLGISPIVFLFLIGLILLIWVNPRGEQTTP